MSELIHITNSKQLVADSILISLYLFLLLQAEAAVRQRALTAIDLFLNSARELLKVLLDNKTFDDIS